MCDTGLRYVAIGVLSMLAATGPAVAADAVLKPEAFRQYIERFNRHDQETPGRAVANRAAGEWIAGNVPTFECPDRDIEEIYYFRWWTYRKHLKQSPAGWVVTEFLPDVPWAGKYNTISCAAGHHFYEGRWIRRPDYLDDYARFWFRGGGEPRRYSFWTADALWARHLVAPNRALLVDLLPDLVANYEAWEKTHRDPNGLFWQIDDRDGMECSIGGSGYRATINGMMYGEALAIARIAELAGRKDLVVRFTRDAARIKQLVQEKLWDAKARFFKVSPRGAIRLVDVGELHGYTPWYFHLPDAQYAVAWRELTDRQGFWASFGPTTAERRHPRFMGPHRHECLWNGPSWPFATSVTLTALANLLSRPTQAPVDKQDYLDLLRIYAKSQHLKRDDGTVVPWIDEDLHPDTGQWIARDILASRGVKDRGRDYNHSTFCDLVITGAVGLRPRADASVEVNPLVPEGAWDYFCLDQVAYHGRMLTILYDKTGRRYGRGAGLRVLADGHEIASSPTLARLVVPLADAKQPAAQAGPNGRRGNKEQIGLIRHAGRDLGFD